MKKTLIAGAGVAALGMAALPFAGVFAANADGTLTQTDTVIVTVDSACSIETTAGTGGTLDYDTTDPTQVVGATYTATIANGQENTAIEGSTFTVTCNDTGGWDLNAVGAGEATGHVNYMKASTNKTTDDIATADGTPSGSASTSSWAFSLAAGGDNAPTITTGYTGFKAVPATSQKVATGTSTYGDSTVTATYGVGISETQSAGTYTGKVQYTLTHPAAS